MKLNNWTTKAWCFCFSYFIPLSSGSSQIWWWLRKHRCVFSIFSFQFNFHYITHKSIFMSPEKMKSMQAFWNLNDNLLNENSVFKEWLMTFHKKSSSHIQSFKTLVMCHKITWWGGGYPNLTKKTWKICRIVDKFFRKIWNLWKFTPSFFFRMNTSLINVSFYFQGETPYLYETSSFDAYRCTSSDFTNQMVYYNNISTTPTTTTTSAFTTSP